MNREADGGWFSDLERHSKGVGNGVRGPHALVPKGE